MSLNARRIMAILRKELREYRRNRSILFAVGVFPLIFLIQPLTAVSLVGTAAAGTLRSEHVLLYMLGIPILTPAVLAAYSVAGERQQGTLEPALGTPIREDEFLIGKALAALLPSVAIAYLVFGIFVAGVFLFAQPGVAPALLHLADVAAQVVFTPLLAALSIWIAIAISTRAGDARIAQQLGLLANIPLVGITSLIAFNVIQVKLGLAIGLGAALLLLDVLGWRIVSPLFDRERLITGTR
jgi:ABC-type transport system involved in multi-copper enzyme maturation permease subunit